MSRIFANIPISGKEHNIYVAFLFQFSDVFASSPLCLFHYSFCVGTMSSDDSDDIGFEVEDDEESNDMPSSLEDDRSETATYLSATTRHSATMSMISGIQDTKTVVSESNQGRDETAKQYNRNNVLRQL